MALRGTRPDGTTLITAVGIATEIQSGQGEGSRPHPSHTTRRTGHVPGDSVDCSVTRSVVESPSRRSSRLAWQCRAPDSCSGATGRAPISACSTQGLDSRPVSAVAGSVSAPMPPIGNIEGVAAPMCPERTVLISSPRTATPGIASPGPLPFHHTSSSAAFSNTSSQKALSRSATLDFTMPPTVPDYLSPAPSSMSGFNNRHHSPSRRRRQDHRHSAQIAPPL